MNTNMKNFLLTLVIGAALAGAAIIFSKKAHAQNAPSQSAGKTSGMMAGGAGVNHQDNSAIFVTEMPAGYRDWKLISVAHEEGNLTDIRAILGNDIAVKAYREGTLPLP